MKIHIKTFGCTNNISESEVMAGLLSKAKHKIVDKKQSADIILINMCSVKNPSITKALRELRNTRNEYKDKKIILTGCIPREICSKINSLYQDISLMDTNNIQKIVRAVDLVNSGKRIEFIGHLQKNKICMPRVRKNKLIGIIPISSGCNSGCAYCSVRLIKGKLFSFPMNEIVGEAKAAIDEGCQELWVTSQDCANYNLENGTLKLVELINKITSLSGDFKIRIGMMNPEHCKQLSKDLIKIYNNDKVYKFLHIPVQAGSDRILKLMNRNYSVNDFKKLVKLFRSKVKDLTLSTDIICGFPTETEEEFKESLDLISEVKPDVLNISRYWKREGTEAAKMKQIHPSTTKERSKQMTELFNKIKLENNKNWIGKTCNVLITDKGNKPNQWKGRNESYKPIVVEGKNLLGKVIKVKIIDAKKDYLIVQG